MILRLPARPPFARLIPPLMPAPLLALLAGCSLAPHYARPTAPIAASFKEAPGWRAATPADDIAKGQWWRLFGDPALDALEQRVAVTNQNVAAAAANYRQARALVREVRAGLFPTVSLSGDATRAGSFGNQSTTIISGAGGTTGIGGTTGGTSGTSTTVTTGSSGSRRYSATLGATWEPDLWGRIASGVRQDQALAQASAADLANATLSAQGEVALDYVQLRGLDRQKEILDATIAAYQDALRITTNRYNQGIVARLDVLLAQTQLTNARASATDLIRQRQAFEHAIAVLVGETPSAFSLAPAPWRPIVPDVPGVLPAAVVERRPDVAAAERRVAAANQAIGIQRAAFFPTIGLSGSLGVNSSSVARLFTAASSLWSVGAQAAETLLDFGARSARVAQARAAYDSQVATYRQTVLAAFQQVEDQLAAGQILALVGQQRSEAAAVATRAEQIARNQYLAGQFAYTNVTTNQATALAARQAEATAIVNRQTSAITLIQAIGGSWPPPAQPPSAQPPSVQPPSAQP